MNKYLKTVQNFLKSLDTGYLTSLILALLATVFFLVTGFPEISANFLDSSRLAGFVILAISLSISFLYTYFLQKPVLDKILLWSQSGLLLFYTYSYYIRINKTDINFFGLVFNTAWVLVLLAALVFFSHLKFFQKIQWKFSLLLIQIWFFATHTFAFIELLESEKVSLRNFVSDRLELIFSIPDISWIILSSLAVSIFAIKEIQFDQHSHRLRAFLGYIFINFLTLAIINNFTTLTYWEKGLIFLVFWDFLFRPLDLIFRKKIDALYTPRLLTSAAYHLFLLVLIILNNYLV